MTCFALIATITLAENTTVKKNFPIRQEIRDIKATTSTTREAIKNEVRTDIKDIRASSTADRKVLQDELKKKTEEARKEFVQKRDEAKKEIEKNREEFRKEISDKKVEVKDLITKKRVELSEKLKVIKDEKKKQIAIKVGDEFQQINSKVLANLTNILTKEEVILQKISSRADVIALQNGDVTLLKESIVNANTALTKARDAIVAQTAKVYTIAVKTEETLRGDTGATRQLLEKDLSDVRDLVKAVHESIKDAAEIFGNTPGVEKIKVLQVSTSTESSTNQ